MSSRCVHLKQNGGGEQVQNLVPTPNLTCLTTQHLVKKYLHNLGQTSTRPHVSELPNMTRGLYMTTILSRLLLQGSTTRGSSQKEVPM